MTEPAQSTIRLRDLEYVSQSRTIVVDGRTTVLDTRSANVFAALVDKFGQGIAKDELLRFGWPGQLVHENSLAKAVSKLRQAISGSGLEIVAAYGFGYTLREIVKADVSDARADEDASVAAAPAPDAGARPRAFTRTQAAFGVLLGLVGIVTAVAWVRSDASVPIRQTMPITNDPPNAVATILWVDDHPSNNELEVEEFRRRRIAVHLAKSTEDAMNLLNMNGYDLVVSDLGRGEDRLAGLRMTEALRQRGSKVPVFIYTLRAKDKTGQVAQRRLVASAGANDLAVTPEEVRAKVLGRLLH
jgi:DNA-binding response OmpR family regulator